MSLLRSADARICAVLLALLAVTAADAQIFRWVDERGVAHFGDQPPAGAERLDDPSPATSVTAMVERVVDGDTLLLAEGRRVRIIGIDAPELPFRGRPGEPGAAAARDFLATLIGDAPVTLQTGSTPEDAYERQLAHVATENGEDIATRMLATGHAVASVHADNATRIDALFAAEAEARAARRGLWATARLQPVPASQAARYRNQYRALRGRVADVRMTDTGTRLKLPGDLTLLVDETALARFDNDTLRALRGRNITVRGTLRQRDGAPVIHLQHPRQIDR